MNHDKLLTLLPLLKCPRTGTQLSIEGEGLVSAAGERYPLINGKPVLVRDIQPMHTTPPKSAIISQNIAEYRPPEAALADGGPILHLGSGNVPCVLPQVVSVDILPNQHVDIVAEAEYLPFVTDSFSWVESGAVFEHLYDPVAAAREVRRVVKPGGGIYIDTAFLTYYHGYPSHFFNMTPQAIETFIVDDFELTYSGSHAMAGPSIAVESLLRRFVENLPLGSRTAILAMETAQLLEHLSNPDNCASIDSSMSQHIRRSLAAAFCVIARKPADYNRRALPSDDRTRILKRDYYAGRVGVMSMHSEAEFYMSRAVENGASVPSADWIEPLEAILGRCAPVDTLDAKDWERAVVALQSEESRLTALRDHCVQLYLQHPRDADVVPEKQEALRIMALESKIADVEAQLEMMTNSRSWRITGPLRAAVDRLRQLINVRPGTM